MDACPPLEDIAAFIDGTLSSEERERVTAHLARCESCYEVFIGAAEFQEEVEEYAAAASAGAVAAFPLGQKTKFEATEPAPTPQIRRKPLWLPLAASIVLTAGVGFFAWQALRPPEITVDSVAGAFKKQPEVAEYLYRDAMRGAEESGLMFERSEFMAGVYLLEFRLLGNTGTDGELLDKLETEMNQVPGWQVPRTNGGQPDLRKLEREVEEFLEDSTSFSFGLWAEGGRLAAATGSAEFFEDRNNRRFLSHLLKEDDLPIALEIQETVVYHLNRIENLWEKGDMSKQDFHALATHFQGIISTIDRYKEDFPDPLEPE